MAPRSVLLLLCVVFAVASAGGGCMGLSKQKCDAKKKHGGAQLRTSHHSKQHVVEPSAAVDVPPVMVRVPSEEEHKLTQKEEARLARMVKLYPPSMEYGPKRLANELGFLASCLPEHPDQYRERVRAHYFEQILPHVDDILEGLKNQKKEVFAPFKRLKGFATAHLAKTAAIDRFVDPLFALYECHSCSVDVPARQKVALQFMTQANAVLADGQTSLSIVDFASGGLLQSFKHLHLLLHCIASPDDALCTDYTKLNAIKEVKLYLIDRIYGAALKTLNKNEWQFTDEDPLIVIDLITASRLREMTSANILDNSDFLVRTLQLHDAMVQFKDFARLWSAEHGIKVKVEMLPTEADFAHPVDLVTAIDTDSKQCYDAATAFATKALRTDGFLVRLDKKVNLEDHAFDDFSMHVLVMVARKTEDAKLEYELTESAVRRSGQGFDP